jgi:hypothetical protein
VRAAPLWNRQRDVDGPVTGSTCRDAGLNGVTPHGSATPSPRAWQWPASIRTIQELGDWASLVIAERYASAADAQGRRRRENHGAFH